MRYYWFHDRNMLKIRNEWLSNYGQNIMGFFVKKHSNIIYIFTWPLFCESFGLISSFLGFFIHQHNHRSYSFFRSFFCFFFPFYVPCPFRAWVIMTLLNFLSFLAFSNFVFAISPNHCSASHLHKLVGSVFRRFLMDTEKYWTTNTLGYHWMRNISDKGSGIYWSKFCDI